MGIELVWAFANCLDLVGGGGWGSLGGGWVEYLLVGRGFIGF